MLCTLFVAIFAGNKPTGVYVTPAYRHLTITPFHRNPVISCHTVKLRRSQDQSSANVTWYRRVTSPRPSEAFPDDRRISISVNLDDLPLPSLPRLISPGKQVKAPNPLSLIPASFLQHSFKGDHSFSFTYLGVYCVLVYYSCTLADDFLIPSVVSSMSARISACSVSGKRTSTPDGFDSADDVFAEEVRYYPANCSPRVSDVTAAHTSLSRSHKKYPYPI